MNYDLAYDPADDIISVVVQGESNFGSLFMMLSYLARKVNETKGRRILMNVLALENKLTLIEMQTFSGAIHNIASDHRTDVVPLRWVMVLQDNMRMREFHQVISQDIGETFEKFHDLEKAKEWLKK